MDKKLLSVAFGVPEAQINILSEMTAKALTEGALVRLHVGRWRGWTTLRPEDLGLPRDKEYEGWLALGAKRLMQADIMRALDACEFSARYYLDVYTVPSPWGRVVTPQGWGRLEEVLKLKREEYFKIAETLIERYDERVESVLEQYRKIGVRAYQRARTLNHTQGIWANDEEEAVRLFVEEIAIRIPSREALRASFRFDWELYFLPYSGFFEGEEMKAGGEGGLREYVYRRYLERRPEILESVFHEYRAALADIIYDAASTIYEALQNGGDIRPRHIRQMYDLIESLETLKISKGSDDIDGMIERFRDVARLAISRSDDKMEKITELIMNIGVVARAQLAALSRRPRTTRKALENALGTTPATDVLAIRQARRRLALPTDERASATSATQETPRGDGNGTGRPARRL